MTRPMPGTQRSKAEFCSVAVAWLAQLPENSGDMLEAVLSKRLVHCPGDPDELGTLKDGCGARGSAAGAPRHARNVRR